MEATATLELNEDTIREALTAVIDPELHMNIIELGLVYNVEINEPSALALAMQADPAAAPVDAPTEEVSAPTAAASGPDVAVEMTLTSPGCPYGPMIMGQVPVVLKEKFQDRIGEVEVSLTFSPPWDPATMASEDVQFELGIF